MQFTKSFSEISLVDSRIAGGKAASLGEMARSGIPVPDGYVLLSSAFDYFLETAGLSGKIERILASVDIRREASIARASERIMGMIAGSKIPEEIAGEVACAFEGLHSEFVAVRSSATSEDSADAAWAGQLDSYLNSTRENLIQNIKRCWASLYNPRAIFYRLEKGMRKKRISVAVVVQRMIESEESGIAFSVHPVTRDRNCILIEAVFGLGELAVSGSVTPDSYLVRKRRPAIIGKSVVPQRSKMERSRNSGNSNVKVRNPNAQKLKDSEILSLAGLVTRIERHYGFPCDVEWARAEGRFYILQCRPITTLATDLQPKGDPRAMLKMWSEENHNYFDLEPSLVNFGIKCERMFGCGIREGMMFGKGFHASFYMPEREYIRNGEIGLKFLMDKGKFKRLLREIREAKAVMHERISLLTSTNLRDLGPKALLEMWGLYGSALSRIFTCYSMTQPYKTSKLEEELAAFLRSRYLPDAISTEALLTAPAVRFEFTRTGNALLRSFSETVRRESYRTDASIAKRSLFAERPLSQKPKLVLLKRIGAPERIARVSEVLGRLAEERMKMRFVWMEALYFNDLFLSEFRRRFKLSKEELRMYDAKEIDGIILAGKRVSAAALRGRKQGMLKVLDNGRIRTFEGAAALRRINRVVARNTGGVEIRGTPASGGRASGRVLLLSYEDAGKHTLRIRKMRAGDIIVTEMTRPNIIQACKLAGAIVTDEGGITSHAAIVAREFRKPCVVGTMNATTVLKDGDMVEVDADRGVVKVMERRGKR